MPSSNGETEHNQLELLVFQPTSFCNLDCSYCYVPERSNTARMTSETLARACRVVANSHLLSGQREVEVLWHAGEPLAIGLAFYERATTILSDTLPPSCTVLQTFQTNATIIDPKWCEFFIESKSLVGVSVDGPQHIHDKNRRTRSGKGSFERVMRGIETLRAHDIELYALSVLTPYSLQYPDEMFAFFVSEEIYNIGFNVEELEGEHLVSSLIQDISASEVRALYTSFMRRFLSLNLENGSPLNVREFRARCHYLWSRAQDSSYSPVEAENNLGRIITISRDGEVFSWSPELASGVAGNVAHFSLGNVFHVESIDELLDSETAYALQAQIDAGVNRCRQTCAYFHVCGGGSPANKFYENGTFDSTETIKCRLQVQALTDLVLAESLMDTT